MQGIVMAGGKGQRLEPLTFDVPKPFLKVAGRPVVEWAILSLARAGIQDVILTTAYKKEVLQEHLGDGSALGVSIQYAEEDTPLGTAGGVKNAEDLIKGPFVVMSGDVVADVDIGKLVEFHKSRGDALATIALTEVDDPTGYGILGIDERGKIQRFKEKPAPDEVFSNLTNAGIYVVEREMLERIPADTKYDWSKDLWTNMIGEPIYGHVIEGHWHDVGHPKDLIVANREQAKRVGKELFGEVALHKKAKIIDAVVHDGCEIDAGAKIHNAVLMEHVHVGEQAVVEDSILAAEVQIGEGAHVSGCVLGSGVEVPSEERWTDKRIPEPSKEAKQRVMAGKA